jgi:hypothetical protein
LEEASGKGGTSRSLQGKWKKMTLCPRIMKKTRREAGDEVRELSSARDVMKLSLKDKRKVLDKQHPEFMPLLSHFSKRYEGSGFTQLLSLEHYSTETTRNAEVRYICVSLYLHAPMIDQCIGKFL